MKQTTYEVFCGLANLYNIDINSDLLDLSLDKSSRVPEFVVKTLIRLQDMMNDAKTRKVPIWYDAE